MVEMRVLGLFQVERVRVIQGASLLQEELIDMGVIIRESKVLEKCGRTPKVSVNIVANTGIRQ
jgi:hypothetical protein